MLPQLSIDEVGVVQPLLAARLPGDPRPRVVFAEASVAHQAFDLHVHGDVDDDLALQTFARILGQQRDVEHDDRVGCR